MVGIPGKSKGCHTCRKRKIRCDLQKPDCARCIQSGRVCEGYDRGAVFLNKTAQGWAKRERLEEAQPRGSGQTEPYIQLKIEPDIQLESSISREKRPAFRQMSDANVKKQLFQGLFFESYFPDPREGRGLPGAWLFEAVRLNNPGVALESSLHALCITRVGRITRDQELIKRGNAFYGFALRALYTSLESKRLAGKDETLAACLILSIYELFESTSDSTSAHENHMAGVERLVLHRGLPKTPLGKALMKNVTYASMIKSLQYRKTSSLKDLIDKMQWWDMQGRLFAKGHTVGALLEDLDRYKNSERHSLVASAQHLKRCVELDAEFEGWYDELVAESPSPIYWTANIKEEKDSEISFNNLALAHLMLDFWALRLILTTTISIICSQVPKDVPITFQNMLKQLDSNHGTPRQLQLATNIMQSLPYCMKDEYGASSSQKCLFSGRVALYALRRHPTERLAEYEATYMDLTLKKGIRFAQDIDRKVMSGWSPHLAETASNS